MNNVLIIDSTFEKLVVILKNDTFCDYYISDENKKHNSIIMPAIDELLAKHNLKTNDISYISAVIGPGSFTGIRLGVSIANALSYVTGAKLIEITAFDVMNALCDKSDLVLCAIPARIDNFYYAVFKNGLIDKMGDCDKKYIDSFSGKVILKIIESDINISSYVLSVDNKIGKNIFIDMLRPLYLKKSQAERMREEKQNV